IPASDLPRSTPGAFDSVVGVDESTGAARRFPMPAAGSPRAYETRADLPASAQPGTAVYVNNDPVPANNGLWAYLDGAWVKSADRFTTMEGRLSTAELDVSGLKDFRVEADARLDHAAHDILDLRDRVPDDAVGYVWGVADEEGKILAGLRGSGAMKPRRSAAAPPLRMRTGANWSAGTRMARCGPGSRQTWPRRRCRCSPQVMTSRLPSPTRTAGCWSARGGTAA